MARTRGDSRRYVLMTPGNVKEAGPVAWSVLQLALHVRPAAPVDGLEPDAGAACRYTRRDGTGDADGFVVRVDRPDTEEDMPRKKPEPAPEPAPKKTAGKKAAAPPPPPPPPAKKAPARKATKVADPTPGTATPPLPGMGGADPMMAAFDEPVLGSAGPTLYCFGTDAGGGRWHLVGDPGTDANEMRLKPGQEADHLLVRAGGTGPWRVYSKWTPGRGWIPPTPADGITGPAYVIGPLTEEGRACSEGPFRDLVDARRVEGRPGEGVFRSDPEHPVAELLYVWQPSGWALVSKGEPPPPPPPANPWAAPEKATVVDGWRVAGAQSLVGQMITDVRVMTAKEMATENWHGQGPVVQLVLSDGSRLYPSRDPEGNGPGVVFGQDKDEGFALNPIKE